MSILIKLFSLKYRLINKIFNLTLGMVIGKRISIDWRCAKILNPRQICFGDNFSSGLGLWLHPVHNHSLILLGDNINFSDYVHIAAINKVTISSGCLVGSKVHITDHSHGATDDLQTIAEERPNDRLLVSKGVVFIDENVWIGDSVVILGGVVVGKGSVIAANSVVNRDVPPFSVVAGSPAKVVRNS